MEQESKKETLAQEADNKEKAFTHLAQGKRHLLVRDYNEAATSLGIACDLLVGLYGEFASECGEAYFNYGKALLELARGENGVLGIEEEREESANDDSDDDEEGDEEKDENTPENGNEEKKENSAEIGSNDVEKKENDNVSEPKESDETNNTNDNETDDKEKSTEDIGENVDNLHLAWEMLEMAKIVFKKQANENKQMMVRLAEVHLKLGEVGLESENYSQAIDDMKVCLEIQLENLDKHDRCIAETHYQLGIAYTLSNEFDNAIEHYKNALNLLKKRVEYLEAREKQGLLPNSDSSEINPFYSIKEEINEINLLLPEVAEKISDVEDYKKETMKALFTGLGSKKCAGNGESSSEQGSSAGSILLSPAVACPFPSTTGSDVKPVSDISHLVRKKRKLETDSSEETSSKQPCPEVPKPE